MEVLYAKYSRERLPDFQTETLFVEDAHSGRQVIKRGLSSQADEHISNIYENTMRLAKIYSGQVLIPHKRENSLVYKFLNGQTWDNRLLEALLHQGKDKFILLLREFSLYIHSLQSTTSGYFKACNEFKKVFGIEIELEQAHCVCPANIDLIFDNVFIIEEKTENIILDCEWVFNFNIPLKFILFRSVYAFWIKYQTQIGRVVTMEEILELLDISTDEALLFYRMEEEFFQVYVHGEKYKSGILSSYNKEPYTSQKVTSLIYDNLYDVQVLLPINNVYTYEKTNQNEFSEEFKELSFKFSDPFEDHIRIDPVNLPALVDIKSIELYKVNVDKLERVFVCDKETEFANLSYSDNILIIEKGNVFSFLTLDKKNHLFLKVPETKGKIIIKVNIRVSKNIKDASDFIKAKLEETKQLYSMRENNWLEQVNELNENVAQLQNDVANLGSQLKSKDLRIRELEVSYNINIVKLADALSHIENLGAEVKLLSQVISEKQNIINLMSNSLSWRVTRPVRFIGRTLKKK
ncbi:hypothetical protein ACP26L_03240 [Paenibacillus sp. S-38]|uniref:hypothetical protein n=1 Tax=Paenibacillus sp. S-38 TaxID=3416710 RepID=UPI003CEF9061